MTATERRASASLASIFALRMLGLFLVLPVFALEAARYPGGDDPARVGLAMGIYGLTQGLLQIPFGIASDWWGRKRVIISGLVMFALGGFIAAWAPRPGLAGRRPRAAGCGRHFGRRHRAAGRFHARRGAHQSHGAWWAAASR